MLLLLLASHATADVVHFRPKQPGGKPYALHGEVLDFTGRELMFRGQAGRERTFPAERVERVETNWPPEFDAGKAAAASGDCAEAIRQYLTANRAERRTWARRSIMAELVACYQAIGQDEQAGDLFLAIVRSDPNTPAFDRIPLAWFPRQGVSAAKATAWFVQKDMPAAVLLGASHLPNADWGQSTFEKKTKPGMTSRSSARKAAAAMLRQLAVTQGDPRIAALAEAQLWRSQWRQAGDDDLARWRKRMDTMPPEVRAGPYFVLANAYNQRQRSDEAALRFLRVPIHFPHNRALASRALFEAAVNRSQVGRPDEAIRLYREIVQRYPESPDRTLAEQALKASAPPSNSPGKAS